MSLDLSWSLLDDVFTQQLLSKLNDVLTNASRPEYIGPITLSNLVLGHEAPEVGIVDVGDVWQEFLQRDEATMASAAAVKAKGGSIDANATTMNEGRRMSEGKAVRRDGNLARFADKNLPFSAVRSDSPLPLYNPDDEMDDDFERSSMMASSQAAVEGPRRHRRVPRHQRIQAFRQYSESGHLHRIDTGSVSSFDAQSSVPPSPWGAGLSYAVPHSGHGYFSAWPGVSGSGSLTPYGQAGAAAGGPTSIRSAPHSRRSSWQRQSGHSSHAPLQPPPNRMRQTSPGSVQSPAYPPFPPSRGLYASRAPSSVPAHEVHPREVGTEEESAARDSSLPSLQLQLSINWTTQSLRITLDTSLLINHPSPAFMSLPLTITITGLSLAAGALLAFEIDPVTSVRRSHFCLLVEEEDEGEDEAGLGSGPDQTGMNGSMMAGLGRVEATAGLSSPEISRPSQTRRRSPFSSAGPGTPFGGNAGYGGHPGFGQGGADGQPTAGERILYNMTLETSVGQADKHVLKNVAKVERFVVSLVRKAIGDELVFPNFYSIELP